MKALGWEGWKEIAATRGWSWALDREEDRRMYASQSARRARRMEISSGVATWVGVGAAEVATAATRRGVGFGGSAKALEKSMEAAW